MYMFRLLQHSEDDKSSTHKPVNSKYAANLPKTVTTFRDVSFFNHVETNRAETFNT